MHRRNPEQRQGPTLRIPSDPGQPQPNFFDIKTNELMIDEETKPIPITPEDFNINKSLGSGGFGDVYMVALRERQRSFAAKKIRIVTRERALNQLKSELLTMMKSNHPNIVRFHGSLLHDGDCWIFMEIMDCCLKKFYQTVHPNYSPLPETILMHIAIGAIEGLNHLKNLRITHRDIKPANILLNCNGSVKLCDFGVSAPLIDSFRTSKDTGTRQYYAPERLTEPRYGSAADVWALGLTLTEVANGRFPYRKWTDDFQQSNDLIGEKRKAPEPLNESFSGECQNFVQSFLRFSPLERPKYAEIMANPYYLQMKQEFNDHEYLSKVINNISQLD